jgi:hypothetical protein
MMNQARNNNRTPRPVPVSKNQSPFNLNIVISNSEQLKKNQELPITSPITSQPQITSKIFNIPISKQNQAQISMIDDAINSQIPHQKKTVEEIHENRSLKSHELFHSLAHKTSEKKRL